MNDTGHEWSACPVYWLLKALQHTGCIHLFMHTFIHWVSCKVLTSSGTIQRSPSTAPPNISMFRHSHCEEFGVSVFCQVTFIYIAQNHISQYLSGLYSLHRVRHPLSLDPRFKWGKTPPPKKSTEDTYRLWNTCEKCGSRRTTEQPCVSHGSICN